MELLAVRPSPLLTCSLAFPFLPSPPLIYPGRRLLDLGWEKKKREVIVIIGHQRSGGGGGGGGPPAPHPSIPDQGKNSGPTACIPPKDKKRKKNF